MDLEARVVIDFGMDNQAIDHVVDYIEEHLDKSDKLAPPVTLTGSLV